MELRSAADGGRPDAWILTDKWTVLVESKLGSKSMRINFTATPDRQDGRGIL